MDERTTVQVAQKKVIFISGPMEEVDRYWEEFEKAEDEISAAGYIPLSPSRLPSGLNREQIANIRMGMLQVADAALILTNFFKGGYTAYETSYCDYVEKPYAWSLEILKEALK